MSVIQDLRSRKPLVLCLTNRVTTMFVANALLSLGASPMMSESVNELEELMKIADALYINLGTLDDAFLDLCYKAVPQARSMAKPILLDPVGAGASRLRLEHACALMHQVTMIKGNASEILALSGVDASSLGVDSAHSVDQAHHAALSLAQETGAVVVITGEVDCITDGIEHRYVEGGHPIMCQVTGMGCALGGLLSAFSVMGEDAMYWGHQALVFVKHAGYKASQRSHQPGSFKVAYLDALSEEGSDG